MAHSGKFCRFVSTAFIAVLLLFSLPAAGMAANDNEDPVFRYSITEEGVTIEEYLGRGQAHITVPAAIDGRPVVRIGAYAFADEQMDDESGYSYVAAREDIEAVSIPYGITEIERGAFQGLEALQSADVPDSVTKLGFGVFRDCAALTQMHLSAGLREIPDRAFQSCALKSIDVPEGVECIGSSAFAQNRQLQSVQLPESLVEIGEGAFGECSSLQRMDLPQGVAKMGIGALGGTGLTECTLPAGLSEVPAGLFMWCGSLQTVRFGAAPVSIVQNAFLNCSQLQTVEINATSEEWRDVRLDETGNASLLEARTVCLHDEEAQPVPFRDETDASAILQYDIQLRRNSAFRLTKSGGYLQLRGPVAGRAASTTLTELLDGFDVPVDVAGTVVYADTAPGPRDAAATGDRIAFHRNGELLSEVTVIVDGDVLGSGVMSLSQLVRMAAALSRGNPLRGVHLLAGDFTGSGSIDLSDIVHEAALLREVRTAEGA